MLSYFTPNKFLEKTKLNKKTYIKQNFKSKELQIGYGSRVSILSATITRNLHQILQNLVHTI